MTGICAFTGKDRNETTSRADDILNAMQTRGAVKKVGAARLEGDGEVAIGICHHRTSAIADFQKLECIQALDGVFFSEASAVTADIGVIDDPSSLFEYPGAFAFLGKIGGAFVAARDPLGLKPLYWGTSENGNYGFASLKGPLKSVGIADPRPVAPGQVIELSDSGLQASGIHMLGKPKQRETSENDALGRLETLLVEAVSEMVPERSGIAFSGGLDSALVAAACKRAGLKPELITVGIAGQPELQHAQQAADDIGLPITTKQLAEDEVLESVSKVVQIVESQSPVTVGISLPFYFGCKQAQELGLTCVVAGQLSDELFGGYARFEEMARKESIDSAGMAMWESVLAAAEGDFAPGDKVATSFGLELRCPFAYLPLAKSALELPFNLRVNVSTDRVVRKYILRRLAEKWGLPAYIVNRPKKAFQYSSGVQKVLVREARRTGRRLGEFLSAAVQDSTM